MSAITSKKLRGVEVQRILNTLNVPTAQTLASLLTSHPKAHGCKCIDGCYSVTYPFGHDIVRRSTVNREGLTGISSPPPFETSRHWLGIVVRGNVVISTMPGLSSKDSFESVSSAIAETDKTGRNLEAMLTPSQCLEYRTTIERVFGAGDIFFVWELVSALADKYFDAKPLPEPYVYDISSGNGYPLLVWPLGSLRRSGEKGFKSQRQYQLLRYSCTLIKRLAPNVKDWEALDSEVLWLPCPCLVEDSQFREFMYALGWHQSTAKRQQVARYERVQKSIRSGFRGDPYLNPDQYGPCVAATLCYLDDALRRFVPLYRFIDHEDSQDPFCAIATTVKASLTSRDGDADRFLLAPHLDGQGGLLSLSMPIASGPVPSLPANWDLWKQGFERIWSHWPRKLDGDLGKLTEWKNNNGVLVAGTMGKRGEGDGLASRNCPFLRGWVELRRGAGDVVK